VICATRRARGVVAWLGASSVLVSGEARAGDAFEIQVYDGTANAPGVPGLELHLNYWPTGHRASDPPQLPLNGQLHATLEPSIGVLPFWELGAYVQSALRADGELDWAGVKLRSKFVTPPGWHRHWRLGINLELAYLPPAYDRDRWGTEVRPIAAWQNDDWLFVFNPILDQPLAGQVASSGPTFEPALKAWRAIGPVAVGLEYYGTLGPLASPLPLRQEEHLVYEVLDVLSLPRFELNAGVGEGLTPASAGLVFKAVFGYSFEPPNERVSTASLRRLGGNSGTGPL
jgi:hypothetical protein